MATIDTAQAAIRRARKRLAHAAAAGLQEGISDRAKARHARRYLNALRMAKEAGRMWEGYAFEAVPD